MYKYTMIESPLGDITIASLMGEISGVFFEGKAADAMQECYDREVTLELKSAARQLEEYFAGTRFAFQLPLHARSTTIFQDRVYRGLMSLPYGSIDTYEHFSYKLGCHASMGAVLRACTENPLPILIPCHRLTAPHGPGMYAGGVSRKAKLQEIEAYGLANRA